MRFQYPSLVTLSSFTVSLPLSLPICFLFPRKVFPQSTRWVQSPSQLVLRFSSRFPFSRAPLYTRRTRVFIYAFFLVSSFLSSLECSQHPFFLLRSPFPPSSLSSSVFLSSSFPSCRAHNCITERFFFQLTRSSPFTFLVFSIPVYTHVSIPEQNCIICSYPQQNGTKRTEVDIKGGLYGEFKTRG